MNLVRIGVGGEHNRHGIAVFHQVTRPGGSDSEFLAGGRPIRIYLEPGEKLTAQTFRNSMTRARSSTCSSTATSSICFRD